LDTPISVYLPWAAESASSINPRKTGSVENSAQIIYGNQGQHYDVNPDGIIIPLQLTGDAVWEAGNIMDRVIILNGRPYDTLDKVIRAQCLGWIPLDTRYTMDIFLTHYGQLSKDGIAPVRIANPPDSLAKNAMAFLIILDSSDVR
jgi:hypothetical protein